MTKEEIFNKNINIAYKIANKYKVNYINEYEDIKQIALIGLWIASDIWDENKGAFTTIAYTVISNNINHYLRSVKKYGERNISIYSNVSENQTIFDILEDPYDLDEEILSKVHIENALKQLYLTDMEKIVAEKLSQKQSQRKIGKDLGLSQPQISRYKSKIKDKLTNILN